MYRQVADSNAQLSAKVKENKCTSITSPSKSKRLSTSLEGCQRRYKPWLRNNILEVPWDNACKTFWKKFKGSMNRLYASMKQIQIYWTFRCTCYTFVIDLGTPSFECTNFYEMNDIPFCKDYLKQVHFIYFAFFMHFHYDPSSNTCMFAFIDIVHTRVSNHESEKANSTSVLFSIQSKSNGRGSSCLCWLVKKLIWSYKNSMLNCVITSLR